MKNSKSTKRALMLSVLSMLLCVAMLTGSTFAWFTDSVVSGKNKIAAGNLDVELEYAVLNDDGTLKEWKPVGSETSLFDKDALWEPGYTQVAYLKVSNVGSLSLNYRLFVDAANEKPGFTIDKDGKMDAFKLSNTLKFGAVETEPNKFFDNRDAARDALSETSDLNGFVTGSIKASEKETNVKYIAVVVYMPEDVGNEANHASGIPTAVPSIELGVKLEATQMVDERDSFGNDYDAGADPDYDKYAEADANALRTNPLNAYRKADGTYGTLTTGNQNTFLLDIAKDGGEVTLIKDIGAASTYSSSTLADYSNKKTVFDLNGNTYTFGELELKQNTSAVATGSSLVIKDGTMVGTINFSEILKSDNAMQYITLDNVNMKWDNPRAWDADKSNYRGLILTTKTAGSVFEVKDSVLDCNASFYTTAYGSDLDPRAAANITNTVVNGRLHGAGLTLNVDGCTVNGEVYCNAANSSKTTVIIKNSIINGNAFFDAASYAQQNDVTIENTIINGNLQTSSTRNNVHFKLTDVTVTGTLGYNNSSWKIPAGKVTIVSGAYGFDPTNYLESGSTAEYNEAVGLWVVTAG